MNHRSQRGISIVEILIVVAISVGVIFVLARFVDIVATVETFLSEKLEPQQDLAQALRGIVTEIRSMGPSSIGSYPIELANATSVVFYSDVDQDGLFERVRYTIGTSTLLRGVVKPSGNPLQYVTSTEVTTTPVMGVMPALSGFLYFGASYTGTEAPLSETASVTLIRVVQVTVTGDVSTSSAPKPLTFKNTITIRNLKSN